MELDAIYRKLLSKEKQDEWYQKELYYKCGLPGYQATSYKQKKGKGFQKHNISAATRTIGIMLCLDPEN
jgi:hypothetical protein